MVGGIIGMIAGLTVVAAGLLSKRARATRIALRMMVISVAAVAASLNSAYWKKPECYLPNG